MPSNDVADTVLRAVRAEFSDVADLEQATRLVARVSRLGGVWARPFEREMGPSMQAWAESERVRAPGLPPELRGLPLGLHSLPRGGSTWHVAVADALDGRLYVVYDSVVIEQQERDLARVLAGVVLVFSVLALLASGAVARWLTTPLNALIERLARWAPGAASPGSSATSRPPVRPLTR